MSTEPKLYEISLILKSENDESAGKILENLKKAIEDKNGRNADESRITKRRLAYPINKWTEGSYVSMKFFLKPEDLENLRENLAKEKGITRYMITAPSPLSESRKPSRKLKRTSERKNADLGEIDKKLEEILGQ